MIRSIDVNDRQIRVFISSTFRDMEKERDILVKTTFPQLRKLCAEHAVAWTEIDLRWGITDEQRAEGNVLPFCLAEIDRCRPFFIGILGDRYGWIPDSIPADLLESQPWLAQHHRCSVTELEILYGAFYGSPTNKHAYFYFRDSGYARSSELCRESLAERIESTVQLHNLKHQIRTAHDAQLCKLREGYANPEQLNEWILEDFTELIERLYPKTDAPDQLDQEAARHEAYARNRRLGFVGRDDLLRRLDEHAASGALPLVIHGDSGCGKSALLAEWVARWRKAHPNDLVIPNYVGTTADSAQWEGLVLRIIGELKRAFAILADVPVQTDALHAALSDWTERASGSRRVILVIDALDQLADDDAGPQLGWLPVVFPGNFCVLVSSLRGEVFDLVRKRGWRELEVPLLPRTDIALAARAYFEIFGKTPPQDIVAKLESTPAAYNALYLRAVLDELRQFGRHEDLQAQATRYLSSRNAQELYKRIIVRWEQDYEGDTDLVGDSLSCIWAARHGLLEAELLEILGHDGQPFPRAMWTPFYLAVENALVLGNGLLRFAHRHLREAVKEAYLPTQAHVQRAHQKLGTYFHLQASITTRKLDEQPWQLWKGEAWSRLHETLVDLDFFVALRECGDSTLHYWRSLPEEFNPTDYVGAWMRHCRTLPRGARELKIASQLGEFFLSIQAMSAEPFICEAAEIADEILAAADRGDHTQIDNAVVAAAYAAQARFLRDTSRVTEAESVFRRSLVLAERHFGHEEGIIAQLLAELAAHLVLVGRTSEGEPLILRAVSILENRAPAPSMELAMSLQILGMCQHKMNRLNEAERTLTRALVIAESLLGPRHKNVGKCLCNCAGVLHALGKFREAEELFRRAIQILEASASGAAADLAAALNNLAQLLQQLNRLNEAEHLSRRQVGILHHWRGKTGHPHPYFATAVSNYAAILRKMGHSPEAIDRQVFSMLHTAVPLMHEGRMLRD